MCTITSDSFVILSVIYFYIRLPECVICILTGANKKPIKWLPTDSIIAVIY